jgi:hypothetical protein
LLPDTCAILNNYRTGDRDQILYINIIQNIRIAFDVYYIADICTLAYIDAIVNPGPCPYIRIGTDTTSVANDSTIADNDAFANRSPILKRDIYAVPVSGVLLGSVK